LKEPGNISVVESTGSGELRLSEGELITMAFWKEMCSVFAWTFF
jgi:hypothetical protein